MELVAFVGQPEAHVLDRAHEHRRIVPRGNEAPALPIALGLGVDRPHHHCAAADDVGAGDAAMQRVLDQAAADALSGIAMVDGELSNQQAGDRIGRASGADGARCAVWLDHARREAVIADDCSLIVNDQDAGKAADLVRSREAGQPSVERRLAAIEAVEAVRVVEEFDA